MNRRGLSIGLGLLAIVLVAVGAVMQNQSNFSHHYVTTQLAEHGIVFTPAANLLPAQQKIPCLVANADKPLKTGKQAECYGRYQIGIDLTLIDNGKTYFQDHYNGFLTRQKMYAAVKSDPNSTATQELVKQSAAADTTANDLLAGEATKGLLLAAYGFSVLGDRAGQAAMVCFVVAGLLLVAAVGLFVVSSGKRGASLHGS